MTNAQTSTLVSKDEAGDSFLAPEGRDAGGDDVQGYLKCSDARPVYQLYRFTGFALITLGDWRNGAQFLHQAEMTYHNACVGPAR